MWLRCSSLRVPVELLEWTEASMHPSMAELMLPTTAPSNPACTQKVTHAKTDRQAARSKGCSQPSAVHTQRDLHTYTQTHKHTHIHTYKDT
mmetsp:Transcript_45059/g.111921  ORF Transcript_45059/g.111921 Transcript_45059/m.111921 type:complete len:91 (+) Transcript_45059:133-405(+)